MRNYCRIFFLLAALALFAAIASHGQSLGEVARQQRETQNAKTTHSKVVTDEDIPARKEEDADSSDENDAGQERSEGSSLTSDLSAEQITRRGEQWKARIEAQKNAVASLQNQFDRLSASIHFVEANRYTNGVQYNQHQLRKQQEARQMQKQLDEQKKKLADMQDAARREGFGNKIYDP